jgi:preprotein translocase subunit SecG
MMSFLFYLTIVLFITVCLFMILLILIQKGRGGGLASAFGGAGGNTAFGSKTGDVLTWATSVVFGVFLVLAVALNLFANARHDAANATATNTARIPTPAQSAPGPGPLNIPTTPDPVLGPGTPPVENPTTQP